MGNLFARRSLRIALGALGLALAVGSAGGASTQAVEWSRLSSEDQRLVQPVVINPQVAREVGDIKYPSRPEVANYLLDHPDFAADLARILREGKYRVRRVGKQYEADDGRGVSGIMKPIFAENGRRIFYLQGRYDTRWLPTLHGRAVLVLDAEHVQSATGMSHADVRVTGYLRIDSRLASALLVIARDFSERTVERKVRRFFLHVERVSCRAYEDPRGLADLLAGRNDLAPERVAEFRRILLDGRRANHSERSSVGCGGKPAARTVVVPTRSWSGD
jgi:hypothetical protein